MSQSLPKEQAKGPEKTKGGSAPEGSPSVLGQEKPVKANDSTSFLDVPLQTSFRRSSDTISDVSLYSTDNENERRTGRMLAVSSGNRLSSLSPAPLLKPRTRKQKFQAFWAANKGLALVILAQLFGTLMNVTIRVLEVDGSHGPKMHPFQVGRASVSKFWNSHRLK